MNIVDALVITLGLDASGFVKGQKEASDSLRKTKDEAHRQGKEIEESGKGMLDTFGKLKVEVLGLFAAFTAGQGIKAFTEAVTAANVAIGRMASNLSSSPETLAAWQGAAERMGGSAEATTNSLQGLSDKLMELHQNGAANQTLYRIQALGEGAGAGPIDFNHGGIQTALSHRHALKTRGIWDQANYGLR